MERDLESKRAKLAAKIEATKNRHKIELRQLETRHAKELGTFRADCVPGTSGKRVAAVERQITQALAATEGTGRRATKKTATKKTAVERTDAKKQAPTAAKKTAKKARAPSRATQGSTPAGAVQAAATATKHGAPTKAVKRSTSKKASERETAPAQPVREHKAPEQAASAPPPCHPCDEASPPATTPTTRRPRAPRKRSMSKTNGNGSGASSKGKPRDGGEPNEDEKARKMQHLGSLATKATDELLAKLGVSPPATAEAMPRKRRY